MRFSDNLGIGDIKGEGNLNREKARNPVKRRVKLIFHKTKFILVIKMKIKVSRLSSLV